MESINQCPPLTSSSSRESSPPSPTTSYRSFSLILEIAKFIPLLNLLSVTFDFYIKQSDQEKRCDGFAAYRYEELKERDQATLLWPALPIIGAIAAAILQRRASPHGAETIPSTVDEESEASSPNTRLCNFVSEKFATPLTPVSGLFGDGDSESAIYEPTHPDISVSGVRSSKLTKLQSRANIDQEKLEEENEAHFLSIDQEEARLQMEQRRKLYRKGSFEKMPNASLSQRAEATGYDRETILKVEEAFKNHLESNNDTSVVEIGTGLTAIMTRKAIILEEQHLNEGGFKVVTLASDYFAMKSVEERKAFVSLKPKAPSIPQTEPQVAAKGNEGRADETTFNGTFRQITEDETTLAGTFQQATSTGSSPFMAYFTNAQQNPLSLDELAQKSFSELTLEEMKRVLPTLTDERSDRLRQCMEEREKDIKLLEEYVSPTPQEEYQQEIEMTCKLAKEGDHIIKVHSIIDLASGEKVMIQEAAGYTWGDQKVVDLRDVRKLQKKKLQEKAAEETGEEAKIPPEESLKMMNLLLEAAKGIAHMHALGVIHRDIKEENILIRKDGHAVLADFGTAVRKKDDPKKAKYLGTPRYSAPETAALDDSERWNAIDEKCDVWSFGMVLQNCLLKTIKDHPAVDESGKGNPVAMMGKLISLTSPARRAIYEANYPEPEDHDSIEHLIWSMTQIDPSRRPSMMRTIDPSKPETMKEIDLSVIGRLEALIAKKSEELLSCNAG